MTWTLSDDAALFDRRAGAFLQADPVRHTVPLTLLDRMLSGEAVTDRPPVFGWYVDGGELAGAVLMTPPFELLLADVPDRAMSELTRALREAGHALSGVNGENESAQAFADRWLAGSALRLQPGHRMRLYRLAELVAAPHAAGHARLAGAAEGALLAAWHDAFLVEAGLRLTDSAAAVADRMAEGRLWVWEAPDGRPVSVAGRNRVVAGVSRVGPVYTPPGDRRQGYGAAVTEACTRDALRRDARDVVLFTDLSNPTSNAIYQRLGFAPVVDRMVLRFTLRRQLPGRGCATRQ